MFLNVDNAGAEWISSGRLFQATGPATQNARLPSCSLVLDTTKSPGAAERRVERLGTVETGMECNVYLIHCENVMRFRYSPNAVSSSEMCSTSSSYYYDDRDYSATPTTSCTTGNQDDDCTTTAHDLDRYQFATVAFCRAKCLYRTIINLSEPHTGASSLAVLAVGISDSSPPST